MENAGCGMHIQKFKFYVNALQNNRKLRVQRSATISVPYPICSMPSIDIDGTPVVFPFKPYDCQLTYIRGVITALTESVSCVPLYVMVMYGVFHGAGFTKHAASKVF